MRVLRTTRLLVTTVAGVSAAMTTAGPPSWSSVRAAAGPPAPRLFDATERLFGAAAPELIFWRDSAGWCPFCCMTWLLLEEMRVPYRMRTVPLRRYLLEGEVKDPEYTRQVGPAGVVPGVQFRDGGDEFQPAINSFRRIFDELEQRYPDSFPSSRHSARHEAAVGGAPNTSIFDRLQVARRAYEACAGASGFEPLPQAAPGLRPALADLDAMLAASGGPYLDGARLTVGDLMLLPFLERTEACVPYFFGEEALAALPFARARALLVAARQPRASAFGALCSDATTLGRTNLRYAMPGGATPQLRVDAHAAGLIDGSVARVRDHWATSCGAAARRDAAARLAARPAAVVAFASRCAATFAGDEAPADVEGSSSAAALDAAMRSVAALLLLDLESRDPAGPDGGAAAGLARLHAVAGRAAHTLRIEHGAEASRAAAAALVGLAENVGVPRDMEVQPARALRSHARLMAEALEEATDDLARDRVRVQ